MIQLALGASSAPARLKRGLDKESGENETREEGRK